MEQVKQCKDAASDYLKARDKFIFIANNNKYWLGGNDNIIGRIGEFIALQYLIDERRNPKRAENMSQKAWDFECDENGETKISVKTITDENKKGTSSHITYTESLNEEDIIPWNELIVIILSKELKVEKIGHITREIFIERNKNKNPVANRRWFNENGLFKEFVIKGDKVNHYL